MKTSSSTAFAVSILSCGAAAWAGQYSPGRGGAAEAGFVDAGIAGFVGPAGAGIAGTTTNGNYVNPIFKGWASGWSAYQPSDQIGFYGQDGIPTSYGSANPSNPANALGPVTGNAMDIVSLGDLHSSEIAAHLANPAAKPMGSVTLTFRDAIANGPGADFAAFENGFVSNYNTDAGSAKGMMFAELGFVEVSTNGVDFARFPTVYNNYLNATTSGKRDNFIDLDGNGVAENIAYLTQDVSNVYNMVGKHANAYSSSWGTPFNLDDLATHALVQAGTVDLNNIRHVRVVDIAGDGTFTDSQGNKIYDAWVTWGTGGLDLEAVGVLNYAGKTLSPSWNSVTDASTRAFIDSNMTLAAPVTVGALQFNGGYRLDGATVTLGGGSRNISISDSTATVVLASDIAGSNGLVVSGGGTVVFEGAKSYTGETRVDGSTLKGSVAALSRDITNNGTVELVNNSASTFSNTISGTGNVRLTGNGNGVVTVTTPQTYTGTTQILAGTLKSGVNNALSDATVVDLSAGAAMDFNGHDDTIGGINGTGTVSLGGANLTLGEKGSTFGGPIHGNGTVAVAAGAATHTLTGANSFVGSVSLQSGTLAIQADTALGNASNGIHFNGGTLQINGTSMQSTHRAMTVADGGEMKLNVVDAANRFSVNGNLSGNTRLGLYGAGVVALSGVNTHTGGVKLQAGTLEITSQSQLGAGTLDFAGGTLRIAGKSITSLTQPLSFTQNFLKLDIADPDHSLSVGSEILSTADLYKYGNGTVVLTTARAANNNYVYDGTLRVQNTSGMSGLTQLYGDSKAILSSGVTNTQQFYVREQSQLILEGNAAATGTVRLYGGTLVLGPDSSVSSLNLTNGGTIAGTGRVKTNTTFTNKNIVSPGHSTGTLKFEDVLLTMNTGSTYRFEIDATGSDLISGIGANDRLTLQTGGIIDLVSLDGTSPFGTPWTLFSGFETITGSLDSWTVLFNGQPLVPQFTAQAGGFSMVVPEPATAGLLMLSLFGMLRRRRQA